jgi:hypothetical protein
VAPGFLGETEGLADPARDIVRAGELVGIFGDRPHHRDHVEDLEAALLRFLDRLLARDHQDRHPAQLRVGRRSDEVGCARAQCGHAHPGLAGVAPIGRGHEAGALFVAGEDQLDRLGARQRIQHVEILFAGHAENIFDALLLEALDEKVRGFGHVRRLRSIGVRMRRGVSGRWRPAACPSRGASCIEDCFGCHQWLLASFAGCMGTAFRSIVCIWRL